MTGSKAERPAWDRFLEFVQTGDTLIVTELCRMTRSILQLLETTLLLEERNIFIVSLREDIDTSTEKGRTFVSTMQALFQVDQQLRAERAAAGRASAKARGRVGGRPRTDPDKLENARILYETTDKTAAEVCALTGVGRRRFFSYIAEKRKERPEKSSRPKAGGTVFSCLVEAQPTNTP